MFDSIQKSRPILRRMEKVGDDHVIFLNARSNVAPAIRNQHAQICRVRLIVISKKASRLRNLWHQFDPIRLQIPIMPRGIKRNTGAEPDEQCTPRSRVEEQGNMRLPFLRYARGSASHLEPVVEL